MLGTNFHPPHLIDSHSLFQDWHPQKLCENSMWEQAVSEFFDPNYSFQTKLQWPHPLKPWDQYCMVSVPPAKQQFSRTSKISDLENCNAYGSEWRSLIEHKVGMCNEMLGICQESWHITVHTLPEQTRLLKQFKDFVPGEKSVHIESASFNHMILSCMGWLNLHYKSEVTQKQLYH